MSDGPEVVSFGGASCRVARRGDGRWVVRWREAGRGRSTTSMSRDGALKLARAKVRELSAAAGGLGGAMVTGAEVELLRRLRAVAGGRSMHSVLDQIEDAVRRLGGWEVLGRALRFYEASGMAAVERVTVRVARGRFLDALEARSVWTKAGLRKELDGLWRAHPELVVCEVETAFLESWIARPKANGESVEARFFNNRLATWMNFFNRCREWGWWPKGEKHPAEGIAKRKEPRRSVPIWSPGVAEELLELVRGELRRRVPYLVIGCWLGLRPTEITRLRWELFDWLRGYVHLDLTVCKKLQEERFVPINARARGLLETWLKNEGLWEAALAGELRGKCCLVHDREMISGLARKRGIIEGWPQDVMRHSYISYRIALGHSKHEIAEQAGNSEGVIRSRYRRPLRREDGVLWFGETG
jgi:integrase